MVRCLRLLLALVGVAGLLLAACGDDDAETSSGSGTSENTGKPTVVVTTNILGDVVQAFVGDQLEVIEIMPIGADPHDFQASARQANQIREADALIVNGGGFEEGLLDVIDAASDDGTPTFQALSAVETIEFGEVGRGHSDDDHDAEHDAEGADPHFFTDPVRMAVAVDAMADFLIDTVDGIDADALRSAADSYIGDLESLDADVESILAEVPDERRVLVTNHEVFGYFADRYGFEVAGTVIPSGSTADGSSAGALAELAEVIESEGVAAIFADASASGGLADALAGEVGDIAVVQLFTESLGEVGSDGATYFEMVRTNAQRIAGALAG